MTDNNVIKHLYVFDDLTHHVRRLTSSSGTSAEAADALRGVGRYLNQALACLDPSRQDLTLSTWDGAAIQLAWELADRGVAYDLLVSQGCNGGYASDTLQEVFRRDHGRDLSEQAANVRVTHYLSDRTDAFYSGFEIGVSKGAGLAEQCREAVARIPKHDRVPRIAVIDDCIQTGKGTEAVVNELLALRPEAQISTLGFIACQATQDGFHRRGWRPVQGVLLRGETYPVSWDTDVYFTKDWILTNAIRFEDGTSHAYIDEPEWMAKIFGGDAQGATDALRALAEMLKDRGLYEQLLAL